jgi:hypothetical protein
MTWSIVLRFVRVVLGQLIALAIGVWGSITIPVINMSIGAFITALFKFLRDTFPKNKFLEWLPL